MFYDAFSQDIFLGHIPYNCVFCPGPAYTGVGVGADYLRQRDQRPDYRGFAGVRQASPLGSFFGVDPNIRTPYVQNWNLNIQQQITNKTMLQIAYVGSKGTKLFRFRDINQPSQAQITVYDRAGLRRRIHFPNCPIAGYDSAHVPRTAYPNFFYVNQEESTAISNYNALQISLQVNAGMGFLPRRISCGRTPSTTPAIWKTSSPTRRSPTTVWRRNWRMAIRTSTSATASAGTSPTSCPHRRLDGQAERTDGAWTAYSNLQDGQPFNFNYNFEGDYSGSGEGFDRPDVVGPIQYGSAPANFINLSSFPVPCTFGNTTRRWPPAKAIAWPGTRHFGNLGRNSLQGPSFKEFNFSVFKNTQLTERVNLQLRAEFFNLFNHPNFANPVLPNFIADPGVNGIGSNGAGLATTR